MKDENSTKNTLSSHSLDRIENKKSRKRKRPGRNNKYDMQYPDKVVSKKYKRYKLNNSLWNNFNTYQEPPLDNDTNIQESYEWISPSRIRYTMMDDGCAEWLKLYYIKKGTNPKRPQSRYAVSKRKKEVRIQNECTTNILRKGIIFENMVCDDIQSRYPNEYSTICVNHCPTIGGLEDTLNEMKKGTPFISQAVLYNFTNKTYGIADLLVRSDKLNDLFDTEVISQNDMIIPGPLLGDVNYHYRVIDIKYSTLQLCSDGKRIRNQSNIQYYKGQLAIYNSALGLLQGYIAPNSYILCKAWRYETKGNKYQSYNCFSRVVHINFDGFDKPIIKKTKDSINWVRNLRYNGHKWSCNPPSNTNLYPNMKNKYDSPYHGAKKEIADNIGELTSLWNVSAKHRNNAHSKNVYSLRDKKLSSSVLGLNGNRGKILDNILTTNRDSDCIIRPKTITNNYNSWQDKHY